MNAAEALGRLKDGNRRFCEDAGGTYRHVLADQRRRASEGQRPFAVVLGCSDSRVPAELVFDQGLGELFVIRVAGNIVAPSQVGSVEFAVDRFGTPLVVVMGHTQCGAVEATLDVALGAIPASPALHAITSRIRPALEPLLARPDQDHAALLRAATRANIRASVATLVGASAILGELTAAGLVDVIGAEYDLATGAVQFFDAPD
jgi:carbonic anhydrase